MLSADVYLYLLKLQKEEVGEKRNGKEAEQAIFLSGGAHPMAMARQPITYAFDMLATFPLPLARWEAVLLSSEGRLAAGVGTPPEGVGVSSFWRKGLGLGISFHFGKGKVIGRDARSRREGDSSLLV